MAAKYSILQYDGRSNRVNSAKCGIGHAGRSGDGSKGSAHSARLATIRETSDYSALPSFFFLSSPSSGA